MGRSQTTLFVALLHLAVALCVDIESRRHQAVDVDPQKAQGVVKRVVDKFNKATELNRPAPAEAPSKTTTMGGKEQARLVKQDEAEIEMMHESFEKEIEKDGGLPKFEAVRDKKWEPKLVQKGYKDWREQDHKHPYRDYKVYSQHPDNMAPMRVSPVSPAMEKQEKKLQKHQTKVYEKAAAKHPGVMDEMTQDEDELLKAQRAENAWNKKWAGAIPNPPAKGAKGGPSQPFSMSAGGR